MHRLTAEGFMITGHKLANRIYKIIFGGFVGGAHVFSFNMRMLSTGGKCKTIIDIIIGHLRT